MIQNTQLPTSCQLAADGPAQDLGVNVSALCLLLDLFVFDSGLHLCAGENQNRGRRLVSLSPQVPLVTERPTTGSVQTLVSTLENLQQLIKVQILILDCWF